MGKGSKAFDFEAYVHQHDFVGALTVLDQGQCELSDTDRLLWMAYCASRVGEWNKAKEVYNELVRGQYEDVPKEVELYLAVAHFHLGSYQEAERAALSVSGESELKNRVMLHIAKMTDDETGVAKYRQHLSDSKEDELSLAAIELYRNRHKETTDILERVVTAEDLALQIYLSICYFKMDCFDFSLEALEPYSQAFPSSIAAANIRACNVFRLTEDGNAAIEVIERHCHEKARQNDIIRHNNVVFQDGQKALKVLPDLVGRFPEAKLNLANYYLRQNEVEAAAALLEGVEADCPQTHALLGVIKAEMGQANRLPASLAESISHFQSVGNSQAESDTILGRQCLASSLILQKKYEDALVYLESIQLYLENDDRFRWNYGIASAAAGRHDEALEVLESVSDESLKSELAYVVWLARSYLKTGDMDKAWACLDTDDQSITYEVLQLLANECYKLGGGHFLFSARAFKELFQIDKFPGYLKGFIGASVGFFRYCIARKESALAARDLEVLGEVADLLEAFAIPNERSIAKVIRNWISQHT